MVLAPFFFQRPIVAECVKWLIVCRPPSFLWTFSLAPSFRFRLGRPRSWCHVFIFIFNSSLMWNWIHDHLVGKRVCYPLRDCGCLITKYLTVTFNYCLIICLTYLHANALFFVSCTKYLNRDFINLWSQHGIRNTILSKAVPKREIKTGLINVVAGGRRRWKHTSNLRIGSPDVICESCFHKLTNVVRLVPKLNGLFGLSPVKTWLGDESPR